MELLPTHRGTCHRCNDPYWPTLQGVSEGIHLCDLCLKGLHESLSMDPNRPNMEARKRLKLEEALEAPPFMIKYMEWIEVNRREPTIQEKNSNEFLFKTNMNKRFDMQAKNAIKENTHGKQWRNRGGSAKDKDNWQ